MNISSGCSTPDRENERYCPSHISPAPLFYWRDLTNTLSRINQDYETYVSLSQSSLEEPNWWDTRMARWNGKTVLQKEIDLIIDSNASLTGWGAACQDLRTGGPWSGQERSNHINCLELWAATLAFQTFTGKEFQSF